MSNYSRPGPSATSLVAGKTAIVTGAAGAIGAAVCRQFAKHGANVVLADLSFTRKDAQAVIQSFPDASRGMFISTDIAAWDDMKALFKAAIQRFGSVEYVVANAAVMESTITLDTEAVDDRGDLIAADEAHRVIDINLKGTLAALRLGLHHMQKNDKCFDDGSRGSILLISSTSGYFGSTGVAGYVSSKHGVTGLLRASQIQAQKHSIRVNGVAPFFTPSKISAGFAKAWQDRGLEQNTVAGLAELVLDVSVDRTQHGACFLACGKIVRELEHTLRSFLPQWVGDDAAALMQDAGRMFEDMGGYPLPKLPAMSRL